MAKLTHEIVVNELEYSITEAAHRTIQETLNPFRGTGRKAPQVVELEKLKVQQAKAVDYPKKRGR